MISEHLIYKGCLRPAMFFGLPMLPFMVVFGPLVIITLSFSFYFVFSLPLAFIVMRVMIAKDEGIFNIIYLNTLIFLKVFKSRLITNRKSLLIIVSNV